MRATLRMRVFAWSMVFARFVDGKRRLEGLEAARKLAAIPKIFPSVVVRDLCVFRMI